MEVNFQSSYVGAVKVNVKVNVQLARFNYRAVKCKCKVIDQIQNKSESKVKRQSGKSITFSKLPNANDGLR